MGEPAEAWRPALERAERRRQLVVVAAEELRALGAGDVFEAPLEGQDYRSLGPGVADRIHELVDEIQLRTSWDVRRDPLPDTYRYEWLWERTTGVSVAGLVVETPAGPAHITAARFYPEEIHGSQEERDARTER